MRVSVFGGASPKPKEDSYEEAYRLGMLLGSAGHTVLTGGYIGTMEAVSKGAKESGTHVVGVTCDAIERFRPIKVNPWVTEEIHVNTLNERLYVLIEQCDAAIALPGGVGTLAEISILWNHMIIQAIKMKPLLLVGEGWKKTINDLMLTQNSYISDHDKTLVRFVPDIPSIMPLLKNT
jgi:uncharacterized protein (TIGR00730 family)